MGTRVLAHFHPSGTGCLREKEESGPKELISGWDKDPDHDGVNNLLEYAFNLTPRTSDGALLVEGAGVKGLPSIRNADTAEGRSLRFEYLRRKATSDPGITYTPEVSENLQTSGEGSWRPVVAQEEAVRVDGIWERVIIHLPSAVPARFARVRVSVH